MNAAFARRHRNLGIVILSLLLATGFSAAAAPRANAQSTQVSGVVHDSSGAPIAGAQVDLQTSSFSSSISTGPNGTFDFDSVPATSGTLIISAKDMQQLKQPWNSPTGAPVDVDVTLKLLSLSQSVMVTANRTATPLGETPASDFKLSAPELNSTPALTLDDKLRQIPGFSLFRRSSSRTANPTTMGVSLRGLGANGASRALVLEDGIPLNDPFGSWVYWDRVPEASVQSIEIAQEGASSLYGSEAMGGVVQFLTQSPQVTGTGLTVDASYGNQNSQDLSLSAGGQLGKWYSTVSGEAFHSDGYSLVPSAFRGSVDTQSSSQHGDADLMVGRKIGANSDVFARGWYFDDSRNNGIAAETNNIRLGEGALGADLDLGSAGTLTLRFYGEGETYFQNFFSVAFDQSQATLTDSQTVPAQGVGGSAVWRRNLGHRQTLVAGFDMSEEIGHSHEIVGHVGDTFRETSAGGRQRNIGIFGEDLIQISPGWVLNLSGRYDHWINFDASYLCTPGTLTCPPNQAYPTRGYDVFNPRATLLHQFDSHVSWSASMYRSFRAPTLNELYRGYRVGNVTTNPNPALGAERLTGGETGVDLTAFRRRFEVRTDFFYNQIINPIANVPLLSPPNPPNMQERENLGRISAPGVEIDAVGRLTDRFQLSAGYQYVDSKIVSAPDATSLLGWVQEVPHNTLTFGARYDNPSLISFALDGRVIGHQLDTTGFYLGSYFALDATASRRIAYGIQAYAAVENFTNEQYYIQALDPGVSPPQLGLPITARIGIRYNFPTR
ncbi:MAG: TonB-dependent receptor [Candidatus Acidiferrales bacterium]